MDQICNFYAGELITQVNKKRLVLTGNKVIIYGTSMGTIGAYFPFENRDDIDFFLHLELYMRLEA
jgi:splicing factor 3B subunit 3